MTEREEISRGLSTGASLRSIAKLLKRAPSTISREVKRNGGLKVGHFVHFAKQIARCGEPFAVAGGVKVVQFVVS